MALNIAVPLSGLGGLSPISPIGIDYWENIKTLVSPIGSESSGVSSLDSEDAKQQVKQIAPRRPDALKPNLHIFCNGRDILDLHSNLITNSTNWNFRYSHLPEKNNISMFWANRSLYNRLGPNGLTPVYTINKCECCDFQYTSDCPNSYLSETSLILSSTTTSPMTFTTASNRKQEYISTKVTTVSTQIASNATPFINQQFFAGYKNNLELSNKQLCNQNNASKTKLNDVFCKNIDNMTNISNNFNKFPNVIGASRNPSELSQLTTAYAVNIPNAPTNKTIQNNMGFSNNVNAILHNVCNDNTTNPTSKYNLPQNFLNNVALSCSNQTTSPVPASHNFHSYTNNNSLNNNNNRGNINNKAQVTSSTNLYSLFNQTAANNSAAYGFNMNNNTNCNIYMNSFSQCSNKSNNTNSNPLSVTSQHHGRMYKYF